MSMVATNSRRLMRSSYWFVVGLVPPTASIAPRWTYGCEVKNLDFTTDGRAHHYELTSAGHDLFKVCVSLGEGATPSALSVPRPPPGFHRIRYYGVLGAGDVRSADHVNFNLQTAHGQYVVSTFGFAELVRPLGLLSQAQTWSA